MKRRVTIYIEDELWDNVKDRAWRGKVSASEYISELLRGDLAPKGKPLVEVFKESVSEKVGVNSDGIDIYEAQKKLDAEKANRNIKEEKIKLVRSQIRSYSKAQQLGKVKN